MSSFAVGLLVGQMSVLIVIALLIRFFIFADSPGVKGLPNTEGDTVVAPKGPQPLDYILEQTYYDVNNHQAETMDWVSVLLALVISTMRQQAVANDNLLKLLNSVLMSDKVPSFIDTIKVTELNLGSDFPLLNNCKVYRTANKEFSNGLEAQFDIDLKDTITLGIETRLLLNYPKSMLAYLPVAGSVSLVNFSGRASVSLVTDETGDNYITFSFAPNFSMEFRIESLVGARSKLQDVPKLGQLVESTLRKRFADKCVQPSYQKIKLPSWDGAKTNGESKGSGTSTSQPSPASKSTTGSIPGSVPGAIGSVPGSLPGPPAGGSMPGSAGTLGQIPSLGVPAPSVPSGAVGVSSGANIGAAAAATASSADSDLYGPVLQQRLGDRFRRLASERVG